MKKNTAPKIKQSWKLLFSLLKESRIPWLLFLVDIAASMLLTTITVRLPWVEGQIMAGEIEETSTIVSYVLVTIFSSLLLLPLSYFETWITARTDRNLRRTIWGKVIHMPMSRLDTVPPTSLVSRVTSDTDEIVMAITYVTLLVTFIYDLGATVSMIAGMNRNMALMMLLLIPFVILANIPSHFIHNAQYEVRNAFARYTNFLAEHLGALKQIKASSAEEKEDAINDLAAKQYLRTNIKVAALEQLVAEPVGSGANALVQAIVLIYGGYLLSTGDLATADMIALYSYSISLPFAAMQFVSTWRAIKKAQGSCHTVAEFIQCEPETMERKQSFAIPDADLKLEDVSFAYEDGEKVLDHVTMSIPTGKVTAIVGPSGSGKTTVLKLLERLYQPTEGKLMFGGVPAEDIHLNEWRDSFGMVPQASPLLFGTVRDNITYGIDEGVSSEKLEWAMSSANVDEIVSRMHGGLDTDVGDVGSKLSGGEKQRIAIARMMIRDPEYLLLDEATSSLDAENEHQITAALSKLMQGRTSVVVAHNLRTVKNADNIIFMAGGRVKAQGTHQQLYDTDPDYRRYVDLQHA